MGLSSIYALYEFLHSNDCPCISSLFSLSLPVLFPKDISPNFIMTINDNNNKNLRYGKTLEASFHGYITFC